MGTTSDKLSYLSTTKNYIKESINLTNINITNEPFRYYAYAIKKGIINVLNNPKEIWNNFEKVTGEGTSIELTSTEHAPIEINLKGNLSQSGEPTPTNPVDIHIVSGDNTIEICGKNLLDKNATTTGYLVSRTTGELSRSGGYQASDYIRVKAGTTYTQSNTSRYYSVYYDNEKNYLTYIETATFTPSQDGYIRTTIANANIDIAQVEVGSSASEYEAYTGQSQLISLGVENMYNPEQTLTSGQYSAGEWQNVNTRVTSDYIEIEQGKTYTISCDLENLQDVALINYNLFDSSKTWLGDRNINGDTAFNGDKSHTFNVSINNSKYVRITFRSYTSANNSLSITSVQNSLIQLEKGNKLNSYTPYGTTPIEVGGIGEYEDEFFKNTTDSEYYDSTLELDKWYLKKRIGKVVLDGRENWNLSSSETTTTRFYIDIPNIIDGLTDTTPPKLLSSHFTPHTYSYLYYNDVECIAQYGGNADTARKRVYIRINNNLATTVATLKSWLSNNNVDLCYVLATPENILLNYTLQETLDSFYSYQGQTNISQTNNDLPFILDVKALKLIE